MAARPSRRRERHAARLYLYTMCGALGARTTLRPLPVLVGRQPATVQRSGLQPHWHDTEQRDYFAAAAAYPPNPPDRTGPGLSSGTCRQGLVATPTLGPSWPLVWCSLSRSTKNYIPDDRCMGQQDILRLTLRPQVNNRGGHRRREERQSQDIGRSACRQRRQHRPGGASYATTA